jgi:hypothetical protein
MSDDSLLIQLAGAIVDATGADWAAAESTADTADEQRLIRELKIVADLAAVHRGLPVAPAGTATGPLKDGPSKWGPLLVRAKIGQGYFGTVYLAWDTALERHVEEQKREDVLLVVAGVDEAPQQVRCAPQIRFQLLLAQVLARLSHDIQPSSVSTSRSRSSAARASAKASLRAATAFGSGGMSSPAGGIT